MNLNDLVNLVLNNLDDIKIEYSNVNGQESLKVNGEEICTCEKNCKCYDDSNLIRKIEKHKNLLNRLDDCLFMEVVDRLKTESVNLKALNEFMDQEHYSEEDELTADNYIKIVENIIKEIITIKMTELKSIYNELIY